MIPNELQIKTAYKQASDEAKEYINSDELFNTFYAIRTKYNLHLDVAGNLALLVDAIILELLPLTEFAGALKEVLAGSSEADYLATLKSVNDDIFTAFRQKTKERAEAKVKEAKELAEKKVREDEEDAQLERELRMQFEAEQAALAAKSQAPKAPPIPASTDPVSFVQQITKAPAKSIIEQKVTAVSAPAQQNTAIPPKPQAPPRYHGSDPYREAADV